MEKFYLVQDLIIWNGFELFCCMYIFFSG